jgi:hypothetical protein
MVHPPGSMYLKSGRFCCRISLPNVVTCNINITLQVDILPTQYKKVSDILVPSGDVFYSAPHYLQSSTVPT